MPVDPGFTGRALGGYIFSNHLGGGTYGQVYRAVRTARPGIYYAIKAFRRIGDYDKELAAFQQLTPKKIWNGKFYVCTLFGQQFTVQKPVPLGLPADCLKFEQRLLCCNRMTL